MQDEEIACANCGRPLANYDAVCGFCERELATYEPVFEIPSPSMVDAHPDHLRRERKRTGNTSGEEEALDVAAYFGSGHAAIYDRRIRIRCPSYDALHAMLPHWLAGLPESARILSAGAGTGTEILTLGTRFPHWRFVAADISADMLAACQERTERAGLAQRVAFHQGPVETCPTGQFFDAATSVLVSHFMLDPAERRGYYRAIAERLLPGGVFILADLFGDPTSAEFGRLFETWLASFAQHATDADAHELDRAHLLRDIAFLPEAELMAMLAEAGFETPTRFYQTWLFGAWAMARRDD